MISDDGIIIASKELLELITSSKENTKLDLLNSTDLVLDQKNYKCSIKSIKISEYILETIIQIDSDSCIEILNTAIDTKLSIPNVLKNLGNSVVTSVELTPDSIVRICAARTNN